VKKRADILLVEKGLARSRGEAQALLIAGRVFAGERRIDKAGTALAEETELSVKGGKRFVSRGGNKLEGALDNLALDVSGSICVDIGASTGGFTDCLLQRGAERVYAVDVGRGLLDHKLRIDERVEVREETNGRYLKAADFPHAIDWVVVDASFIGIGKLLPAIAMILNSDAQLLGLVKPQFEVGRDEARRAKGVIRDPQVRERAVATVKDQIAEAGFEVLGGCDSRVAGPKGNVEYFVWARRR
jgi:23S rRNA (cytidine1920-2'-O)/16S rRNA (cytidine1409-2'-O)-methyltransferase